MPKPRSSIATQRLPATVLALGITSFFTDAGSEMIFPLLPAFMASLGAAPAFLGLVEGLADATASLVKLASGYVADQVGHKKPLVVAGYGIATVVRPLMGVAVLPWHVLAVRLTDRVGKGVRSAPRDALIASAVPAHQAGRAFGLHRALDHAGAVVGPLLATALLSFGFSLREVFLASVVPGVLAVVALVAVREPLTTPPVVDGVKAHTAPPPLPRAFWKYLGILALFALGNSSDAFLLLRAADLGVSMTLLPTLWVVLHLSKLLCSYAGGVLADRVSRASLIVAGFLVYAVTYLGLALASSAWHVWALFSVYGLYYGLTEPSEKALVKDIAPAAAQGRAFGLYHFVTGVSAIPAGLLTGFVWQGVSLSAALMLGAAISVAASTLLLLWSRGSRRAIPGRG